MTEQSRIDKGLYWDRAWSLVSGCTPVSEGCRHCWSAREAHVRGKQSSPATQARYGGLTDEAGQWTGEVRLMHGDLEKPLRVQKPTMWSVWTDLFHGSVPPYFIYRALAVANQCPQHTFQILTKRADRMAHFFETFRMRRLQEEAEWLPGDDGAFNYDWPMVNLWLGVTAENQAAADERREYLRQCPAAVKYVSYEPALGPVDWAGWEFIDWLIAGGESGPKARPAHPEWFRMARKWAQANGVAFFMKQWGAWLPNNVDYGCHTETANYDVRHAIVDIDGSIRQPGDITPASVVMAKMGKRAAGRLLDGQTWNEMPRY